MSVVDRTDGSLGTIGRLSHIASWAAFLAAFIGAISDSGVGRVCATVALTLIAVAPLARVALLVTRWRRIGDLVFCALGAGLLTVVGAGALIAAMRG